MPIPTSPSSDIMVSSKSPLPPWATDKERQDSSLSKAKMIDEDPSVSLKSAIDDGTHQMSTKSQLLSVLAAAGENERPGVFGVTSNNLYGFKISADPLPGPGESWCTYFEFYCNHFLLDPIR